MGHSGGGSSKYLINPAQVKEQKRKIALKKRPLNSGRKFSFPLTCASNYAKPTAKRQDNKRCTWITNDDYETMV